MANNLTRRECKPCSAQRRERISAGMRAAQPIRWSADDITRLRQAFARGSFAACRDEFPHLRKGQVNAAARRYCVVRAQTSGYSALAESRNSVWADPDFHRRWHEALTGMSY